MDEKDFSEKTCTTIVTESKMKKFWVILTVLLVLLIPICFLYGIISDRESYRQEAVDKIASSWGNVQTIRNPFMYFNEGKDNNIKTNDLVLQDYNANVVINTEIRKKGIFKIPVYTADVSINGLFKNKYGNLTNKKIITGFTVEDSRGFIENPILKVGKFSVKQADGTKYNVLINSAPEYIPFEISYKIRGLNELFLYVPGQNNKIKISGNWNSPSFEGNFLPASRKIDEGKFEAMWSIPKIATTSIDNPKIGVSLLVPVDNYRMTERTLKYSFLFLSLTFISYFIFELTSKDKRKIHPLQYCLLGCAMQVFYLLLVSLSEFLSFGLSYLLASLLIIILIGTYTYAVITQRTGKRFSLTISSLMSLLYMFLYVLLRLEDFSLLLGSFGMLAIIAVIMYSTRNVNWYSE